MFLYMKGEGTLTWVYAYALRTARQLVNRAARSMVVCMGMMCCLVGMNERMNERTNE